MLYLEKISTSLIKLLRALFFFVCVVVLCIEQYDKVCMFYAGVVRELSHKTSAVTHLKKNV